MKALVYAIAGCLLILAAPLVTADDNCPGGVCRPPVDLWGDCAVVSYWISPQPGARVDPTCL